LWSLSPDIAEWLEVNTTELQLFPGTLGGGDIHVAGAGVR
jgi:hypothetical protein